MVSVPAGAGNSGEGGTGVSSSLYKGIGTKKLLLLVLIYFKKLNNYKVPTFYPGLLLMNLNSTVIAQ